MIWQIEWSHAAGAALRAIPWRDAARIDAAVQKLAIDQDAELARVKEHPTAAKLRVGSYLVYLNFNQFDGTLTIWFIYRT
jgi:mRNA-degrading endonuclease RelE of RelBE toxin-antitoxin system